VVGDGRQLVAVVAVVGEEGAVAVGEFTSIEEFDEATFDDELRSVVIVGRANVKHGLAGRDGCPGEGGEELISEFHRLA